MLRTLSWIDKLMVEADRALRTLAAPAPPPTRDISFPSAVVLSPEEDQHAAGLMRINHTGEVCAQALYFGHAALAQNATVRQQFYDAAAEEGDHLHWCALRLRELDSRASLANPIFYLGSFALGAATAFAGDAVALGFVGETERQVEAHLLEHDRLLPIADVRSRAILGQMRADEAAHGAAAMAAGGASLPWPIPLVMHRIADVMRWVAYRL